MKVNLESSRLIWREFYMAILHHFPYVLEQAFRERLRSIPWRNDEVEFAAWCEGRTGHPVVDAAMRQLRLLHGFLCERLSGVH